MSWEDADVRAADMRTTVDALAYLRAMVAAKEGADLSPEYAAAVVRAVDAWKAYAEHLGRCGYCVTGPLCNVGERRWLVATYGR